MKQIQDSLLERYKARQVKKLAIGGWMQQDWTGTKKPMSVEDQQLNGVDVTTNFNSYGTAPVASSTQPTGEFTDGFGDSMTVGEEGSGLTTKQGSSLMSGIVNVGTGAIMAANKKNNNPNSKYTNAGYYKTQTAASGASTGASLGASFGPIGIAAGAVIGGVAGYAVGTKKDKQAARDFSADQAEFRKMRSIERDGRSAQQGLFQNGSASQYYKNGGKLWKPGTAPAGKVDYNGLATTEYNEPNMPLLNNAPLVNIAGQTLADQFAMGKGYNLASTMADWKKRPTAANSINVGLEAVKLGVPVVGDALVNTVQEGIYNYTDPEAITKANQYGMPGNAAKGPEPKKKPFKSTPTKVPISSSTAVKKPLKQLATGGSLLDNFKRTSSSTAEVHGPSHEQGGVLVPGMNAEVEGGETLAGDYVFSDELGFAKLHKPIALAKGKIEKKPATRERLNTLKLLNEKENNLKLMQEYVKSKNNLQ